MDFVRTILFISLICGLVGEPKVPAGFCVSKIVNWKLVQVGDCKKDDGSDILDLIQKSLEKKKKAENRCDVTYKEKCFRTVMYATRNVTFNDAQTICKSMNYGKPANIYDFTHYQSLRTCLRPLIPASSTYISVWTGMEYKNNKLLLSSGDPITIATEVWYPNRPKSDASWKNVGVDINENPEFASQGMFNMRPLKPYHGVICEI